MTNKAAPDTKQQDPKGKRPRGKSLLDIAREVFPDAPDKDLEYAIWNRTGYPGFWPKKYKTVAGALRGQLRQFKRGLEALPPGAVMCDFCTRPAEDRGICKRCRRMLS